MQKDIQIPEVKDVFLAAVLQENEDFKTRDWNVFLINNGKDPLENILIVSRGNDGENATSTMRHSLKLLPAKSFAKIEFLQEEVLKLNNLFSVSFFAEGKLFHKNFTFEKNSVREDALREIPLIPEKGILLK
ncbi:MAG TPA: hypothetical protein VFM59_06840 [Salinimicrobium sp.]|nr:hypothetical protein [Salinimicrobium sp.]